MRVASEVSLRMKTGVLYLRAMRAGFDRDVETIFDCSCREDDARAVAVPAIDRLEQIALLDVGRQAGARSAALDIDDDERDLGHRRPADGFGLERNAGAGAAGDGEIAGDRKIRARSRPRPARPRPARRARRISGSSLRRISMTDDHGVIG